jgi:excisionase family DNA binding protein
MAGDAFFELVAAAIADAQRPLVGVVNQLSSELAEARRELRELRAHVGEERRSEARIVYLTLPKVAEWLGVSRRTARRWIDSGRMPHVRLPGGGIRVSVADLERVLSESAVAPRDEEAA